MATSTGKTRIGYAEGRAVFQQFKEAIFLRLSEGATLRAIQTELTIPIGYTPSPIMFAAPAKVVKVPPGHPT